MGLIKDLIKIGVGGAVAGSVISGAIKEAKKTPEEKFCDVCGRKLTPKNIKGKCVECKKIICVSCWKIHQGKLLCIDCKEGMKANNYKVICYDCKKKFIFIDNGHDWSDGGLKEGCRAVTTCPYCKEEITISKENLA